jgi:hypothetical protein
MIDSYDHPHHSQRSSPAKNRMREICTSGSVGGEGGNILAYPAIGVAKRRNKAIAPYGRVTGAG